MIDDFRFISMTENKIFSPKTASLYHSALSPKINNKLFKNTENKKDAL